MAMAMVQQAQAYQLTNRGTLVPGQTISVNKYPVQVERYLSQGGFAHVYLVRTAQPVYNTHHHVLKRIAVQSESMLSEVKKEVDIMRILRGHPNIVYLIDAAWHRMPNGMYEVFILMEFCQGGGIIDMMNRRLRERLTEAEILQIFVDVCEGVAAMHNLRPPLLHRDLKVENILQASSTSYKLCDFGSAAPVAPRVPSTTAEIRALEADLNRHTTLQYRAPEMVDPYLRRPIDEKSDVWALGVLLYKLCYYTTPFEEHGPLAILNVQYKIPPYPVYSSQMNGLIASMLREHGTQRPSVFELLNTVHRLRGTKSRFTYNVPIPQPLSPRLSRTSSAAPPANPLDDLVTYRSSQSGVALPAGSPPIMAAPGSGVQARDKVLEAIAPMRRGRPNDKASRPPSPTKPSVLSGDLGKDQSRQGTLIRDLDMGFGAEGDEAWKAMKGGEGVGPVRGHKSGLAAVEAWKVKNPVIDLTEADPWLRPKADQSRRATKGGASDGFGDSFSASLGLSSSSEAAAAALSANRRDSNPSSVNIPPRPPSATPRLTGSHNRLGLAPRNQTKDAFDGLGLSSSEKTPVKTLGDVGRSRTGLVVPQGGSSGTGLLPSRPSSSNTPLQPTPSPKPQTSYFSSAAAPPSPKPTWGHTSSLPTEELSPEQRFPSVEELDRTFGSPSPGVSVGAPRKNPTESGLSKTSSASGPPPLPPRGTESGTAASNDALEVNKGAFGGAGVRSQQVTGIAMMETQSSSQRRFGEPLSTNDTATDVRKSRPPRPSLSRKHRSSLSIKHTPAPSNDLIDIASSSANTPSEQSSQSGLNVKPEARDWLTGTDDEASPSSTAGAPGTPVLRRSPSKRASVIQGRVFTIPPARAAITTHETTPPPSPSLKPPGVSSGNAVRMPSPIRTGTVSAQLTDNWSPVVEKPQRKNTSSSSGSDEGPEDVNGFTAMAGSEASGNKESRRRRARSKSRQSSVHDLVDLWGGSSKDRPSTPQGHATGSQLTGQDTQRLRAPAPPSPSRQRSDSPEALISSVRESTPRGHSPKRRVSVEQRKQPPAKGAIPSQTSSQVSGRSRPQSMFIFPVSKNVTESVAPASRDSLSTGLKAPENPRRSSSRRTSISDMVQMYESRAKQTPSSPPVAPNKPANLKLPAQAPSPGPGSRFTRISPTRGLDDLKGNITGQSLQSKITEGSRGRLSPTGLPRESTTGTSQGSGLPDTTPASGHSYRSVPLKQSFTAGPSSPERPRLSPLPLRKPTVSAEDPSPQSPDKPYQGVGKLIDQWQRKTAEADRSNSPQMSRRGGFAPRRGAIAPTVPGGSR